MDLLSEVSESTVLNSLIGHHSGLEDIEWVSSNGTNTTGKSTSDELGEESSGWLVGTDETLHWLVETESEGGVGGLSAPGGSDSLVEGGGTLISENGLDNTGNSVVLLSSSSDFSGDLESGLDNINWVNERDCDDGGSTGTGNVGKKGWLFLWHFILLFRLSLFKF